MISLGTADLRCSNLSSEEVHVKGSEDRPLFRPFHWIGHFMNTVFDFICERHFGIDCVSKE